tara:strand:+ start:1503 stop:3332 length:1830 start_codon:yes stop_codon:yes gene_type:complete
MAGNHMSQLSPRQRMINMMYLVLTALLALNVSKEVLDAFFRVDKSLTQTVSEKAENNLQRYADFSAKAKKNPTKIARWDSLAQALNKETEIITTLIDSIRFEVWAEGQPVIDKEVVDVKNDEKWSRWNENKSLQQVGIELGGVPEIQDKANTNSTTIIMLDPNDKIPGEPAGVKMKNAINRYREFLLSMDVFPLKDSTYQNVVKDLFNTESIIDDGVEIKWEERQYRDYPIVGVLTFLNQTALDVRTAEDVMLELLEQKTGESIVSIDKQIPYGLPKKSYMMTGDELEVSLLLAGIDTKTRPIYDVYELDPKNPNPVDGVNNGKPLPKGSTYELVDGKYIFKLDTNYRLVKDVGTNPDGMATFKKKMSRRGKTWVGGVVSVVSAMSDDGFLRYPWATEILVEQPMSVISPVNLNAIYVGIENDFRIAVPGYEPSQISLKSDYSGCTIKSQGGGDYKITVDKKKVGKKINLFVRAKKGGKIGETMEFKVYALPNASTTIDKRYKGDFETTKGKVGNFVGLYAKKDPSFVYDLKYEVVQYSVRYTDPRGNTKTIQDVKGNKFSDPRVKSVLESVKSGKTISFFDIKTVVKQNKKKIKGINPRAGTVSVTVK